MRSATATAGAFSRARPAGTIGPAIAGAASLGELAGRAGVVLSGAALTLQQVSAGRNMGSYAPGQQGATASRGAATGKPASNTSTVMETNFATLPHLLGYSKPAASFKFLINEVGK